MRSVASGGDDLYQMDAGFDGARIVGFEVVPISVHHEWNGEWKGSQTYLKTCNMQNLPSDRDPLQMYVFQKFEKKLKNLYIIVLCTILDCNYC